MKKIYWSIFVILLISVWKLYRAPLQSNIKTQLASPPSAIGNKEDPLKRFNYDNNQLIDPTTGKIPDNIHNKEAEFVKNIPTVESVLSKPGFRTK